MLLWLSLVIKNEEINLQNNFLKFYKYFDYVVIVDTGSTDSTQNIININGVYTYNYALSSDKHKSLLDARNYSIQKNKADWVLVMDADEFISPHHVDLLRKFLSGAKNTHSGYFIEFEDYRYWTPFKDYKLCLLKNSMQFSWGVHANPQIFFRENNKTATLAPDIKIQHKPNSFSPEKTLFYIDQMLFFSEQEKNNARYFWFLGYSYFKLNEYKKAKEFLIQSFSLYSNYYPVETINSGLLLACLYLSEGLYQDAIYLNNQIISFFNNTKDDFEVKVNSRIENTIKEISFAWKNSKSYALYEFMY